MWVLFAYGNTEYYHIGMNYVYTTDMQLSNLKLEMSQKYTQYIDAPFC